MSIILVNLDPSLHKNRGVDRLHAHSFSERDQVIVSACLAIHSEFDAASVKLIFWR